MELQFNSDIIIKFMSNGNHHHHHHMGEGVSGRGGIIKSNKCSGVEDIIENVLWVPSI